MPFKCKVFVIHSLASDKEDWYTVPWSWSGLLFKVLELMLTPQYPLPPLRVDHKQCLVCKLLHWAYCKRFHRWTLDAVILTVHYCGFLHNCSNILLTDESSTVDWYNLSPILYSKYKETHFTDSSSTSFHRPHCVALDILSTSTLSIWQKPLLPYIPHPKFTILPCCLDIWLKMHTSLPATCLSHY